MIWREWVYQTSQLSSAAGSQKERPAPKRDTSRTSGLMIAPAPSKILSSSQGICKKDLTYPFHCGMLSNGKHRTKTTMATTLKMNSRIGKTPVQIEAASVKELFQAVELICQLPSACGNCKSEEIGPGYSKTRDGDEFFFLKCPSCGWEFKLGQRKADGELFPQFNPTDASGRPLNHKNGWKAPFTKSGGQSDESAFNDQGGDDDGGYD